MNLTTAQRATFKTWLDANTAGMDEQAAANSANTGASPSYFVWLKTADKATVDAAIIKSKYTPTDTVPAGSAGDLTAPLQYGNRAMMCQLQQTNAQWLTAGPASISTIDARLAGVRQNFNDCMTGIPSGVGGASANAGWGTAANPGAVRNAMMRAVTNFEKLYVAAVAAGPGNVGADPRGNNTNPDILGTGKDGGEILGPVSAQDVSDIRGGLPG